MNYLTNYYKNLSEQLQEKVNILESYLQQINEDLEPGTVMQNSGSGAGTSTTSTNQNTNTNSDLNNFLQAWGSSDPAYDYNRDGVVDGNDLGIHLSRMLDRGTRPTMMASTVPGTPGTPETVGGQTTKRVKPLDQPGVASMPGTTRKISKTPTRMASTDGQGPSSPGGVGTDDEITGGNNAGGGNPPPPPPPQGPGFSAEPFGPPPALRPKYNYGAGAPIPPSGGGGGGKPPSGGGGGGGKPPSGGGGGPVTPPPPTMPPRRAKVAAPGLPAAAPTSEEGSAGFYDTTMTDIGEPAIMRGQIPYWMSNRTTDVDTSFRGMQRKRKG